MPRKLHVNLLERDLVTFRQEVSLTRARQAGDSHCPRYHLVPPANWMNDPNGLIQWRGRYHLFYQHNPRGPLWADMHWGHAMSGDLVHWRDLPIALAPTPKSYDEDGIFSGCAVDDNGVPTIVYTGVRGTEGRVCLAMGDATDANLVTWRKWPGNPVIPHPPAGLDFVAYRDPSVWREDDGTWYMVHGAGIVGVGGAALLYRSPDLRSWEYLGPLFAGDMMRQSALWTGSMWECPQLFRLGGKHVLLVSVWHEEMLHHAVYMVGTFDGRRFAAEHERLLDAGVLYAPQTMEDDRGRRLLWGWLRESRGRQAMAGSSWNGVMSLPWELTLRDDSTLGVRPVQEVEVLRRDHLHLENLVVDGGTERLIPAANSASLELTSVMDCGDAVRFGLVVRRSLDGVEQTRIIYDPAGGRLTVDRRQSSADMSVDRTLHEAPLKLTGNEPLRLRVFLDRSVIEVFANERIALTDRIYPTHPDSLGIAFLSEGGTAQLQSLDVWSMDSIFEDAGSNDAR